MTDTFRLLVVADDELVDLDRWTLQGPSVTDTDRPRAEPRFFVDRVGLADALEQALATPFDAAIVGPPTDTIFERVRELATHLPSMAVLAIPGRHGDAGSVTSLFENGAADVLLDDRIHGSPLAEAITNAIARKRFEAPWRNLVEVDQLTGIGNPRQLRRRFEVLRSERGRRGGALVVVTVDVDGFRAFNSDRGHQAGDELLSAVSTALTSVTRTEDASARLTADRFAAVVLDRSAESVDGIVQRMSASVGTAVAGFGSAVRASVGGASATGDIEFDLLLDHADRKRREVKASPTADSMWTVVDLRGHDRIDVT